MDYRHEIIDVSRNRLPFKYIVHRNDDSFVPKHWHRAVELSYTVSGSIDKFNINGRDYHTKPGDVLIVNTNRVHSVFVNVHRHAEPQIALTLLLPYKFMDQRISDLQHLKFIIPFPDEEHKSRPYHRLQADLADFYKYTKSPLKNSYLRLIADVYDILFLLVEYFSEKTKYPTNVLTAEKNTNRLMPIIDYIQHHYDDRLSIGLLSTQFHLSPSYFSRYFRKYMQTSPMEYVNMVRLQAGYQLLMNSDKSVQYISDHVGFPNIKGFISTFRKIYRTTPANYRRNSR